VQLFEQVLLEFFPHPVQHSEQLYIVVVVQVLLTEPFTQLARVLQPSIEELDVV